MPADNHPQSEPNPAEDAPPNDNEQDIVEAFLAEHEISTSPTAFEDVPAGHRSGFVAVVGRPNVGKSTLINAILGTKIAIVSAKPQTTRVNQLGILTRDDMQVVFIDTPGIHQPRTGLGEFMVDVALQALRDADVILFVGDVSERPTAADRNVASIIQAAGNETVLRVLNKVDAAPDPDHYMEQVHRHLELSSHTAWYTTIATERTGIDELLAAIQTHLPEGPRFYPPDQISDLWEREIANEMIREAVLRHTEEEIPHAAAVYVEEYKERENGVVFIRAVIYVERESQKPIVIGKGGSMIKQISQEARHAIEDFLKTRIYLDLRVKVLKNWRTDENALRRLGYRIDR
jgi:GTPase